MAREWVTMKFGDLLIDGTRNGIYKPKEFHGSGAKIVNMGEPFAYPRLYDVPMKRLELTESDINRSTLEVGDLLFARRSLVAEGAGKCSIVMEVNEPTAFESSIIRARPNPDIANGLFLFYLFNSPHSRYLLGTILRQVAVSGITGNDLVQLEVPLPPLPEQRAIAHILGTLDDKIELNRRMNETLEAMARAIFKSWFLDFDPVRAKMRGEQPVGLASEIADLFLDALVETELGEAPEGWKQSTVSAIVLTLKDSVMPGRFPTKVWEHYSIPAFDAGRAPILETGDTIKRAKYRVPSTCVLVSKLNPQFPRVWCPNVREEESAICSTEFIPFVPRDSEWRSYLFELMKSESIQRAIEERVTGSTGSRQRAKSDDIASIPVVVPPQELLHQFSGMASCMHARMHESINESRILARLRDTLLPKLISGELRVADAERMVGGSL